MTMINYSQCSYTANGSHFCNSTSKKQHIERFTEGGPTSEELTADLGRRYGNAAVENCEVPDVGNKNIWRKAAYVRYCKAFYQKATKWVKDKDVLNNEYFDCIYRFRMPFIPRSISYGNLLTFESEGGVGGNSGPYDLMTAYMMLPNRQIVRDYFCGRGSQTSDGKGRLENYSANREWKTLFRIEPARSGDNGFLFTESGAQGGGGSDVGCACRTKMNHAKKPVEASGSTSETGKLDSTNPLSKPFRIKIEDTNLYWCVVNGGIEARAAGEEAEDAYIFQFVLVPMAPKCGGQCRTTCYKWGFWTSGQVKTVRDPDQLTAERASHGTIKFSNEEKKDVQRFIMLCGGSALMHASTGRVLCAKVREQLRLGGVYDKNGNKGQFDKVHATCGAYDWVTHIDTGDDQDKDTTMTTKLGLKRKEYTKDPTCKSRCEAKYGSQEK